MCSRRVHPGDGALEPAAEVPGEPRLTPQQARLPELDLLCRPPGLRVAASRFHSVSPEGAECHATWLMEYGRWEQSCQHEGLMASGTPKTTCFGEGLSPQQADSP